jgi:hypothetical protein
MIKIRMEAIEKLMKLTGMSIEDGIKLAFKTLDDTYEAFPRLEKPTFVILNGKEYPRPK